MVDLRERFQDADLIPAPDLWASARARAADEPDRVGHGFRLVEPEDPPSSRRLLARKVLTIAVAILIAVVGIGLVVRALSRGTKQPATPSPSITERWVSPTALGPNGGSVGVASLGGNSYVLSAEGSDQFVTAFDADGHRIWRTRPVHDRSQGGITADATGVYVAGRALQKYDLLDGHRIWGRPLSEGSWSYGPWVASDGSGIYVFTATGTLQKFDPDGATQWSIDVGGSAKGSGQGGGLTAAPAGGVYLALFKGNAESCVTACHYEILRIDSDGSELWNTDLKDPPLYYGPIIHLGSDGSGLYVLTNGEACRSWVPSVRHHGDATDGCVFRLDLQGHVAPGWPVRLIGGEYRRAGLVGTAWGNGALIPEAAGVLVVGGGGVSAPTAMPLTATLLEADGTSSWTGTIRLDIHSEKPFLGGMTTVGDDLIIAVTGITGQTHVLSEAGYVASLSVSGLGGSRG